MTTNPQLSKNFQAIGCPVHGAYPYMTKECPNCTPITNPQLPEDLDGAIDELNQILSIVVSGLKPKDIVEATEKYIKYRIKQLQTREER